MSTATSASTFEDAQEFFASAFAPLALEALSLVGQGISIITPDFRIVWASPALQSWAGPLEEIRGRYCYEVYQCRGEVCPNCPSAQAFATGERGSCLQGGFARDGTPLWFELTCGPVKDGAGAVRLVMEIATDITETLRIRERERLLAALIEQSRVMVALTDREGVITDANPAMALYFGCRREELVGRHYRTLLGGAFPEEEAQRLAEAVGSTGWSGALQVTTLKGEARWIDLLLAPVTDPEGRLNGTLALATEITERKHAEAALRESERRYRLLAENVTDVIWTADLDLRMTYVSPSVTRLYGCTLEEARCQSALDTVTPASRELVQAVHEEELALERSGTADPLRSRTLELEERRKDGSTLWTEVTASFLRDEQGCPIGLLGITRDVTERKQAEEALRASEERYRNLFERLNDAVFIADPATGLLLDVNQAAERLMGCSRDELIGMHQSALHPPGQAEHYREKFRHHISEGTAADFDAEIVRKDGAVVPVYISAAVAEIAGREVLQGVFRDVTERNRMEEALRRSELLNRSLVEHLPQRIFLKDRDSVYLSCNASYGRDLGIEPQSIVGKDDFAFYPRQLADAYRADDQAVMASGAPKDIEERYLADGEERWVHTIKVPYRDEQGHTVGVVGIFEDITERKRMEAALAERQRSLEASNARLAEMTEEMQQFLYLVSHDLRSPLVTVEGFASRLLKRHADECGHEARHALERIRAGVDSMARLIESLLRLSRAHTTRLNPVALDMNEIAAQVARDLEQQAADAQVRFEVQPALPPAWGDPQAAYQVLLNLVSNAVKYHGDTDPWVSIGGQVCDEGVELTVRDNGIGIEADKLESVFQMFTRADATGRPGLGIGLAGAKRLVERHGGRIWAESVPGQGSTFHFILPHREA